MPSIQHFLSAVIRCSCGADTKWIRPADVYPLEAFKQRAPTIFRDERGWIIDPPTCPICQEKDKPLH